MATVLLTIVAASIVLVAVRFDLLASRSDADRIDAAAAEQATYDALRDFEERLAANPSFFLSETWSMERARVCVTVADADNPTEIEPGEPWPAECGQEWAYADRPPADPGTVGYDSQVRAEVAPPTLDDPLLRVRILARVGSNETGLDAAYRLEGTGRFVAYSEEAMRLDALARGSSGASTLRGSVYTGDRLFLPTGSGLTIDDTQLMAETGFVAGELNAALRYYTSPADDSSTPPMRDIRGPVNEPLTVGGLRASAARAATVGCPVTDPGLIDVDGRTLSRSLCLLEGRDVVAANGTVLSVPDDVAAWLLIFDGDEVTVYLSQTTPAMTGDCTLRCDLVALAAPEVAAGTHPGSLSYWGAPFGVLPLPVSGVVVTGDDTHIGLCGDAFLTEGAECDSHSGSVDGTQISRSVTVVAGSASDPANVWLSGPIFADGNGRLGVVASDSVLVPFWARPPGTELHLDVAAVALGYGETFAGAAPVRTFPRHVGDPFVPGDTNFADTIRWTGSLAASSIDLSFDQYDQVELSADPVISRTPTPWFPAFVDRWSRLDATPLAPASVCAGARTCTNW